MDGIIKKLEELENLLKEQKYPPKQIFTFQEACVYLGISESTGYKLTSKSLIKHYKPGGKKIKFLRPDLDAWLLSNPIRSRAEIGEKANSYLAKAGERATKL